MRKSLRRTRLGFRRALKCSRKKLSEKSLHALRIETRRLLALLEFLEDLHSDGDARKARRALKKQLDLSDELRDTQVHLKWLKPLRRRFPEAGPLKKWLRKREQQCAAETSKHLREEHHRKLLRRLKALERRACDTPPSEASVADALQQAFDRVMRLRSRIRGRDAAAIHKMRVAFKRFRYLVELFEPLLPWATETRIVRLRKFQSAAGDIQDCDTLLARLDGLVGDGELKAQTVEKLRTELASRKHAAIEHFLKHINDVRRFDPRQHAKSVIAAESSEPQRAQRAQRQIRASTESR